jgi:hypothetical protein
MTERGSFVKPGHTLFELIEHFVQFGYCPNVLLMQLAQYDSFLKKLRGGGHDDGLHVAEPTLRPEPAGHGVQLTAPTPEDVPDKHGVHDVSSFPPAVLPYFPAGQLSSQKIEPSMGANVPRGQNEHDCRPTLIENLPVGHRVGAIEPA